MKLLNSKSIDRDNNHHPQSQAFKTARKFSVMLLLLEQYVLTEEDLEYLDTEDMNTIFEFYKRNAIILKYRLVRRGIKIDRIA